MQLVEQHVIDRNDPRYSVIDAAAFASKNNQHINADVNGAYNIVRKVTPDAFTAEGVEDGGVATPYVVHPARITLAKPRKIAVL